MNRSVSISVLSFASMAAIATTVFGSDFTITPLLTEGQAVADVGLVTRIDNLSINNAGQWLVEADTDHADTNADTVLVRSGVLYLREGQALTAPAGTSISSFDSITLNNDGQSGWNIFLDGATTVTDSGIFLGDQLLIQESNISAAPQFSAGTPYIGWFETKINDNDMMLLVASVDDPAIATTVDRALVRLFLNPDGTVNTEDAFAKEGDVLPGQIEPVADFLTGSHGAAFNAAGQAMYVADLAGDTTRDQVVYRGFDILAQEGEPSPIIGRNWSSLSSARVHLNDAGGYVHTGTLSGDTASDLVIVRSGGVVKQEGDAFGAFAFTGFGSAPVYITNQGRVLWYGAWNDPVTTQNEGLFLDDELLVQEGVTTIGGVVVQTLRSGESAFASSTSGRYIAFEAVLANGIEGAFQVEVSYCPGDLTGGPEVDINDLTALLSAFGRCSGQAGYLYAADFDFDGCVSLSDLTVLLAAFGGACP
jgi:hypothetical protein